MTQLSIKNPRKVTAEQIRAVSAKDPIYEAGAIVNLQRGIWVLDDEPTDKEA